eukprot:jgi/Chrzof1/9316/UNPLg00285.t1
MYIEPLSHALRHPLALCGAGSAELLNRDFILLESARDVHHQVEHYQSHEHGKNFYFDLGASTYKSGAGGSSQQWLIEAYSRRGIEFDRILMWEAKRTDPSLLFAEVPKQLMGAYQYFNVPISADVHDLASPLSILRRIARPSDFVVLKIDIDNWAIEKSVVQYILENDETAALIDEMAYEHHVDFKPMLSYWGTTADMSQTLKDSYEIFKRLRHKGIRVHGWP